MSDQPDIASRARVLHAGGLGLHDIAQLLQTHPAQVERWLASVDHNEAEAAHRAAWSAER